MLAYLAKPQDPPWRAVRRALAGDESDAVLFLDLREFVGSSDGFPRNGQVRRGVAAAAEWIQTAHEETLEQAVADEDEVDFARVSPIVPCIAVLDLPAPGLALPEAAPIARAGGILVGRPEGYDRAEDDRRAAVLDDWVRRLAVVARSGSEPDFSDGERYAGEPAATPLRGQDDRGPDEAALDVYYNPAFGLARGDFERLIDATRSRDREEGPPLLLEAEA